MTRPILLRRLFAMMVILASVTGVAWTSYCEGYRSAENKYQSELDRVALRQLVDDTEEIRARLGRAPTDQGELESHLGRPIPKIHDDGVMGGRFETSVYYIRTGNDSFQLTYELRATDDWTYDSTKPEAGWIQSYY